MNQTTKYYLLPNGISRTIIPNDRPTFNEWANYIHNNIPTGIPDPGDDYQTEDEFEAERERKEELMERNSEL